MVKIWFIIVLWHFCHVIMRIDFVKFLHMKWQLCSNEMMRAIMVIRVMLRPTLLSIVLMVDWCFRDEVLRVWLMENLLAVVDWPFIYEVLSVRLLQNLLAVMETI